MMRALSRASSGRGRRIVAAGALVLGASLAGTCRSDGNGNGAPDAAVVSVGPEDVVRVERGTLNAGPSLVGTLEPERRAVVRAEVGGSVLSVEAERGEAVDRGEILARLESTVVADAERSARLAVASAEQALRVAERQVERTQRLVAAGALAERDLELARNAAETARAQLGEARARLASASDQLDATTVRSPMDGVVSERAVGAGDVVAPGAALYTIIDLSSMRLEASVPAEALTVLRVGTPVMFEVRGYPDRAFRGHIERIAPAADPDTRQIPILVSLPNPGRELLANLFAVGRVAARSRQGLIAPDNAVDETVEPPTVSRVRDGVVQRVPVELGLRDELRERVEIASGLAPGDLILVGPAREIPPGTPVKLTGPAGPGAPEK